MSKVTIIVVAILCYACQGGPSQDTASPRTERGSLGREEAVLGTVQGVDFGMPLESLAPATRESLREIKVFRINDKSIDTVWDFESNGPEGVMLLECSSEVLSTGRMEKIAAWAKSGHGIIVQAAQLNLSPYLLPSPNYVEYDFSEDGWELVEESPLLRDVSSLGNHLWCADLSPEGLSGVASLRFRRFPKEPGNTLDSFVDDIDSVFSNSKEEFIPVIVGRGNGGERKFVLFASTFKGARVLWFSGYLDVEHKACPPKFDDAMFWANLMHWLAAKPLPESGKAQNPALNRTAGAPRSSEDCRLRTASNPAWCDANRLEAHAERWARGQRDSNPYACRT